MISKTQYTLPRAYGLGGVLFSCSEILKGTIQSYFGPRQRPDAFPGGRTGVIGIDITMADAATELAAYNNDGTQIPVVSSNYLPPGKWMTPGTLLRPPQVVWLTDATLPLLFWGTWQCAGYPSAYDSVATLSTQLQGIFADVKQTIEGIRLGRTWVEIPVLAVPVPIPSPTGLQVECPYWNWSNYKYGPIVNPPDPTQPGATPYVGTAFLHVWVGFSQDTDHYPAWNPNDTVAVDNPGYPVSGPPTSAEENTYVFSASTIDAYIANEVTDGYASIYQMLSGVVPHMAAYGVYLYPLDLSPTPETPVWAWGVNDPSHGAGGSVAGMNPTFTFDNGAEGFKTCGSIDSAQEQVYNWRWNGPYMSNYFEVKPALAILGASYGANKTFTNMANALSDFNVVNMGGASTVTSSGLVQAIAAFFNFDPSTGLDLPSTP